MKYKRLYLWTAAGMLVVPMAYITASGETVIQNSGANPPLPTAGYQPGPTALSQNGQLASPPTAANLPGPSIFIPAPSTIGHHPTSLCLMPGSENKTSSLLQNQSLCSSEGIVPPEPLPRSRGRPEGGAGAAGMLGIDPPHPRP